jgi:hypothetical protein
VSTIDLSVITPPQRPGVIRESLVKVTGAFLPFLGLCDGGAGVVRVLVHVHAKQSVWVDSSPIREIGRSNLYSGHVRWNNLVKCKWRQTRTGAMPLRVVHRPVNRHVEDCRHQVRQQSYTIRKIEETVG